MPQNSDMGSFFANDDVLGLGGGIVGLACAHYLLQSGRQVRVLERERVGRATSFGNCGTLTPSHASPLADKSYLVKGLKWMLQPDAPFYIKPRLDPALWAWLLRFARRTDDAVWQRTYRIKGQMLQVARREIESMIHAESLACGFEASGLSYVFNTQEYFDQVCGSLAVLAEFGVDSEVLNATQLRAREPALRDGMSGGIHFAGDAHLKPNELCAALTASLRSRGAIIEEGFAIDAIECGAGGVRVRSGDQQRIGRQAILALGPWSNSLLDRSLYGLPIQPGKGYSITYSKPPIAPKTPLVLKERQICVTSWDDGYRLGSTMEFSGFDASMNRRRLNALELGAAEYLRHPVGLVKQQEWFGWRPMTVDDLPIMGRAPGHNNLWLAAGHGMLGVTLSAWTGKHLAALMCGEETELSPGYFSPLRNI